MKAGAVGQIEIARATSRCYRTILHSLLPLLVVYSIGHALINSQAFYVTFNGIAPVYLIAILLLPVYRLLRRVPESIWAPAAWLPVSFAVFYGFGPLVAVYGNEDTLQAMASTRLAASPAEVFRANNLSALGITSVVAGFWLSEKWRSRTIGHRELGNFSYPKVKPASLALIFVVFGGVLRHGILKPADWSVVSVVIPGVVSALGPLVDVGYGLLAFAMVTSGRRTLRQIFWLTWPIHLFLCTLSLSKAEIVTAMLLPALGGFLAHRKRKRLVTNLAVIALVFMLAQPWVHFGRGIIASETGTINQAGYVERLDLLGRYISGERIADRSHDQVQSWWMRLNFSQVQSYAMDAYDSGRPGSTLSDGWMYFVPRIIWPEKPIMDGPGRSFYSLVTGRDGTSFLALSVFGDLYWQFGWIGVIVLCPLIGWFFSSLSWRSMSIMQNRQFIMMPVVLLALNMALLGMNKYLVNGIIAVIPLYYSYLFAMAVAARTLKRASL